MKHPIQSFRLLMITTLMGLMVWSMSPPLRADALPIPEYQAQYKVSWRGLPVGTSEHRLILRPDGVYHISTVSTPYISFLPFGYTEKTDFEWKDGRVTPLNYFYDLKEGTRHKRGHVLFDRQKGIVKNEGNKNPWEEKLSKEMYDKLTHALQLRIDLMDNQSKNLTYKVAEDDEVKPYHFTVLGKERLTTALGPIQTLKVQHLAQRKNRKTIMWLDPHRAYLPVKLQHYRDNKLSGQGEIMNYTPTKLT